RGGGRGGPRAWGGPARDRAMPVVLFVSAILLVHVILALIAGRFAAAAIGVAGLSFALFILRDWHRAQAEPPGRMDGERAVDDGCTLVAMGYRGEVVPRGDLLGAVEPSSPEVIVVGVTVSPAPPPPRSYSAPEDDGARLERDPHVIDVLSRAVAGTGRP